MRATLLLLGALAVALLTPRASAEILRFKNGTRMRGTIVTRTPKEVVVRFDFGTTSFAPDDIVAVEPEPDAEPVRPERPSEPKAVSAAPAKAPGAGGRSGGWNPEGSSGVLQLADAMRAVAFITVEREDGQTGVGTGTIISPTGIMLTNDHVVKGARKVYVQLPKPDSREQSSKDPTRYEARVLKTNPDYDLAILSIPVKTPQHLRFADDGGIHIGDAVRAIGNPQGLAVSVSSGIISSIRTNRGLQAEYVTQPDGGGMSEREFESMTWIQTDAAINPGNSGGPLLNDRNEIVGINSFGLQESGDAGLNFALHVKHLRRFAGAYAKP